MTGSGPMGRAWQPWRVMAIGVIVLALAVGSGAAASANDGSRTPRAVAAIDTPCRPAQVNAVVEDRRGRPLVCAEEWGHYTWRLGPDAVARKAHAGFRQLARSLQAQYGSSGADLQVIQEPGFPRDLADAALEAADLGARTVGQVWPGSSIILAVTPEFYHRAARRLAEPCWDTVTEDARESWLMEFGLPVLRKQTQSFGHSGLCSNVYFVFLNKRKPNFENHTPLIVMEGFLREYLIDAQPLDTRVPSTENEGRVPCWEGESQGWNLAWALMEQERVPGFSFASRWAHWVSDLAGARGSYRPGLVASTPWVSATNGDVRYDMPCQANPGIGHVQGALAREWLMATVGPAAYEAYPLASQRTGELRQSLLETTGVRWDAWIDAADRRTARLLDAYPASHQWFPRLP